jgi:hypothetical protein
VCEPDLNPLASGHGQALVHSCELLADAAAADDPQLAALALAELYKQLTARGWKAPPPAQALLRLHDMVVMAELDRQLQPRATMQAL